MKKTKTLGLRHLALWVVHLEECTKFYCDLLDMHVDWQPDADNIYLSSGHDIFALHRSKHSFAPHQSLQHFGFILENRQAVDELHELFKTHQVQIKRAPQAHRDGSYSFYCADPEGNTLELIYYPPILKSLR